MIGLLLGTLTGCSDDDDTEASGGKGGTGGSSATGGTGGSSATGGTGGSGGSSGSDAGPDGAAGGGGADAGFTEPTRLSETGLYDDIVDGTLGPGVDAYRPQFQLWSDGATKQRWLYLPPGSQIDTSDMDYWKYPIGTKVWKEFTRDDVRVETRLIQKHGPRPSDWFMVAFQWNEEQTDALAVPDGVQNASNTQHDVPARTDCEACHGNMRDRLLSVSAIQLSHDLGDLDLDTLIQRGSLSDPPAGEFQVPGTEVEKAALGYLHANCGLCHNPNSGIAAVVDMQLWLATGSLASVAETPTYTTTIEVETSTGAPAGAPVRVRAGNPAESSVFARMNDRGGSVQMPPVGTELVDTSGVDAVSAWISALPPP
jgi:hypothetical protein